MIVPMSTVNLQKRIKSIDVLRGMTIAAMILVNTPGTWESIFPPLEHAPWHGYTPTDLIFPFFLFIVGLSIHFAYRTKSPDAATYRKIAIRSLKIIGIGFFLGWFLPYYPFFKSWDHVRIPGVLQRIGVVFFVVALLNLHLNWKSLLILSVVILLGYWLWMGFVPINGMEPTFDRAPNNWANRMDKMIFGTHTWKKDYDPEGLLSTFPAIVTSIIGVLIGKLLSSYKGSKLPMFSALGVAMLLLGYLWSYWFPINKALWSSSFVLVTAGWGTLFLGIIHYIMDEKGKDFGKIFKMVGANAIIIYFLSSFISKIFYLTKIGDSDIHSTLYHTFFTSWISYPRLSSLMYALSVVGFYLLLGWWLYRKKIFIKV